MVGELVGVSFVGVPPGVVVVDAPVLVVKFVGGGGGGGGEPLLLELIRPGQSVSVGPDMEMSTVITGMKYQETDLWL